MQINGVLVFLILLTAPLGLLLGVLTAFLIVPLYYRVAGTPPEKRKIRFPGKCILAVAITFFSVIAVCGFEYYQKMTTKDDYWRYQSDTAYWRMPLGEPYELVMRGTMDIGYIGRWQEEAVVLSGIAGFEQRGSLVAGQLQPGRPGGPEWFLFDCAGGTLDTYTSYDAFHRGCTAAGFDPPIEIETVRHNWYVYWGIIEDRKKR